MASFHFPLGGVWHDAQIFHLCFAVDAVPGQRWNVFFFQELASVVHPLNPVTCVTECTIVIGSDLVDSLQADPLDDFLLILLLE